MITITNNKEGKEKATLSVTKGAYESFYKRLGYSIIENASGKEKTAKVSLEPAKKIENDLENVSFEDTLGSKVTAKSEVTNSKKKSE